MPFNLSQLTLISDPCQDPKYKFAFPLKRQPRYRFLADTAGDVAVRLLNQSRRIYKVGQNLRNVELAYPDGGGYLEASEMAGYRVMRDYGHFVSVFGNYDVCTTQLCHFEENLSPEIGVTPDYTSGSPDWDDGPFGRALYINGMTDYLHFDDTLPSGDLGAISFWMRSTVNSAFDAGTWAKGAAGLFAAVGSDPSFHCDWCADENGLLWQWDTDKFLNLGDPALDTDTWYHMCFVWNKTGVAGYRGAYLYWNGSLVDSTTTTAAISGLDVGSSYYLGRGASGYAETGVEFDDFRVDAPRYDSTWGVWYGYPDATAVEAMYDRGTEAAERMLAMQTQGHYFHITRDPVHLASIGEADKFGGTITLEGAWSSEDCRIAGTGY